MFGNYLVKPRTEPTITFSSGTTFRVSQDGTDKVTTGMASSLISDSGFRVVPTVARFY